MTMHEKWFWLLNAKGIGLKRIEILLNHFGTIEAIYQATEKELLSIKGFGKVCVDGLQQEKKYTKKKYHMLLERNIQLVLREEEHFPQGLRLISEVPYGLFYRGKLPDREKKSIAIVGSRSCSTYGREMAKWFGKELSWAGIQVISGMARGIDGYAHVGAIEAGKENFAVLGSGIDVCYPPEHQWIYDELIKRGGIISEYCMGVPPVAGQFPMRNRIISGLCDGILIVEAEDRSGSLITADYGLEQGKDIFVVPGRIGDKKSYGCNRLIKMGAYLVQGPSDILGHYHFSDYVKSVSMEGQKYEDSKKNNYMLETKEKIVYANLSYNPKHINEIMMDTKFSLSEVMDCLISLELKGYIKQTMKNFYIVCNE